MEEIYSKHEKECELVEARPDTIRFLLDFSRALKIIRHEEFKFESVMN